MRNFKRFNRNLNAISPIFATLILIAIAVIAGVVVYMFTTGTLATMTGGGTAGQEKVSVQAVDATGGNVYVQVTSGGTVEFTGATIKDSSGNVVSVDAFTTAAEVTSADGLTAVPVTFGTLAPGTYTVTLTTAAGSSFVSASFTA